jgi:hypothetical protein
MANSTATAPCSFRINRFGLEKNPQRMGSLVFQVNHIILQFIGPDNGQIYRIAGLKEQNFRQERYGGQ